MKKSRKPQKQNSEVTSTPKTWLTILVDVLKIGAGISEAIKWLVKVL